MWSRGAFRAKLQRQRGQVAERGGSENASDCMHTHPSGRFGTSSFPHRLSITWLFANPRKIAPLDLVC